MRLRIDCQDRLGITQDILDILVQHEIDLRGIEIQQEGHIYLNFPTLAFEEFSHLMPKIRKIDGIEDVKTVAYLPMEREHQQLFTFIHSLQEPVFSIDSDGNILLINQAALAVIELSHQDVVGQSILQWMQGFNFNQWLSEPAPAPHTRQLSFVAQQFVADIYPVYISDAGQEMLITGAIVMLKTNVSAASVDYNRNPVELETYPGYVSAELKKLLPKAQASLRNNNNLMITGENGTGKTTFVQYVASVSKLSHVTVTPDSEISQIENQYFNVEQKTELLLVSELELFTVEQQRLLYKLINEQSVQVIASSHWPLNQLLNCKDVNQQLIFAINQTHLNFLPLRETQNEIVGFARHIISTENLQASLSTSAVRKLQRYDWPGNLVQLRSVVKSFTESVNGNEVTEADIPLVNYHPEHGFFEDRFEGTLEQAVKAFEAGILKKLYPAYPSSRALGKKLGISHTAIANKIREYGIGKK